MEPLCVDKLTADKKTSKTVQWADDVTIKDIPHASVTEVTQPLIVRTTYVINYNVLLMYNKLQEAFTGQVIEHGSNGSQVLNNREEVGNTIC